MNETVETAQRIGVVQAGIAPLYGAPLERQVIIDEGLYGMEAEILAEEAGFWKVRMEYGYEGYIAKAQLRSEAWPAGDRLRVIRNQIDVMERPEVDCVRLQTMPRGSVLLKAGAPAPDGWISVRLADGTIGYTKRGFVSDYQKLSFDRPAHQEEEQLRNKLVQEAQAYEGAAYRWGGKSPQGIDCSGLCAMAYLMNGIIIYRDAAIKEGFPIRAIPQNRIGAGDLLFFKGHVALYIGGPRQLYIHSTAKAGSDGVDYNSLRPDDSRYRRDLAEGIVAVGSIF